MPKNIKCIFCNNSQEASFKLIVVGEYFICDKCIQLFNKIINTQPINESIIESIPKPNEESNPILIKQYLDKYVIGQDTAKTSISVSIANHYKRMQYEDHHIEKSNLIITGPSGSGKSFLIETVANFLEVPYVIIDATTLTEAGYIGENVDTIISRLVLAADGDLDSAEHGIVFIDEIDKIAIRKNQSSTSEGRSSGIQSALLKMVEGSIVRIQPTPENKRISSSQTIELNTKNILFICGGAFSGMKNIIAERLKKKTGLGFGGEIITSKNINASIISEDFINFGMIPEFIGRFPYRTYTEELTVNELVEVMSNLENNILTELKFYFETDGIDLEFTPDFIRTIAEQTHKEKLGARGLRNLLSKIMENHLYLLPEYKIRNIAKMIFDKDTITGAIPKIELLEKSKKKLD